MPKDISFTITVNPDGEQPITKDATMTVDDYDEFEVTVKANDTKTVRFPNSENRLWLLAVEPLEDVTDQSSDALTCKFIDSDTAVRLDQRLMIAGQGEWRLLGKAPKGLQFKNETKTPRDVKVTIGIKVIAASPPGTGTGDTGTGDTGTGDTGTGDTGKG